MAQSKPGEGPEASTRVVLEGDDAVENAAALLRSKGKQDIPAETPSGLLALATAISAARGDLAQTLEHEAQALSERDRRELLDEMLALEQENPGTFLAGALAGFALGRATAEPASGQTENPVPERQETGEAGIVSSPIETAQTGPGGLGHLEAPPPDDDTPGKEQA